MARRLPLIALPLALAAPLASAAPQALPIDSGVVDVHGVGMIPNDDPLPALSVDDVTVTEGDSGTVTATFTVSLDAASTLPITVDYATADDTATAPDDYLPASGTLAFTPGQTSGVVTVKVNGDTLDEIDETYTVNLS